MSAKKDFSLIVTMMVDEKGITPEEALQVLQSNLDEMWKNPSPVEKRLNERFFSDGKPSVEAYAEVLSNMVIQDYVAHIFTEE